MNFKEYLDPDNGYALLKQAGNMPLASHWIEVPEGAECFIRMCTGLKPGTEFFFKDIDGDYMLWRDSNWVQASYDCAKEYIDEGDELLWSREQAQEQGLISGADALRALADGKEVQCTITGKNDWTKDIYGIQPYYFLGGGVGQFQFRLKPRTIKLELKIPAPFEPSECEEFYVLSSVQPTGYIRTHLKSHALLGAWHTEEEIKQVVEVLRGGIKA